jgi:hypothetical protein
MSAQPPPHAPVEAAALALAPPVPVPTIIAPPLAPVPAAPPPPPPVGPIPTMAAASQQQLPPAMMMAVPAPLPQEAGAADAAAAATATFRQHMSAAASHPDANRASGENTFVAGHVEDRVPLAAPSIRRFGRGLSDIRSVAEGPKGAPRAAPSTRDPTPRLRRPGTTAPSASRWAVGDPCGRATRASGKDRRPRASARARRAGTT